MTKQKILEQFDKKYPETEGYFTYDFKKFISESLDSYLAEIEGLIVKEILICHEENTPTSRLTSLALAVKKMKNMKNKFMDWQQYKKLKDEEFEKLIKLNINCGCFLGKCVECIPLIEINSLTRRETLKWVLEMVGKLPDSFPDRESDEFDAGCKQSLSELKSFLKEIINEK